MEVLDAIQFIVTKSWEVLTGIKVPGFEFSFATLFVGLFLATLGLRFLGMILGVGVTRGDVENVERMDIQRRTGEWPQHYRRYK